MAEMIISQDFGGNGVSARLCDEQAGATLYTTYFDLVFATCYGILRDREEAAEATQETFMRALRTLDSLPEDPRAWLKVVARNHCLDLLRRRRRKGEMPADYKLTTGPSSDPELTAIGRSLVNEIFSGLQPRERTALWYAVVQDLPLGEMASRMEISYPAAAQLLHRARRRAAALMRETVAILFGPQLLRIANAWQRRPRLQPGQASELAHAAVMPAALVVISAAAVLVGAQPAQGDSSPRGQGPAPALAARTVAPAAPAASQANAGGASASSSASTTAPGTAALPVAVPSAAAAAPSGPATAPPVSLPAVSLPAVSLPPVSLPPVTTQPLPVVNPTALPVPVNLPATVTVPAVTPLPPVTIPVPSLPPTLR